MRHKQLRCSRANERVFHLALDPTDIVETTKDTRIAIIFVVRDRGGYHLLEGGVRANLGDFQRPQDRAKRPFGDKVLSYFLQRRAFARVVWPCEHNNRIFGKSKRGSV